MFLAALSVGLIPREIGRRFDPYDAYPSQLQLTLSSRAIVEHSRLLGLYCLPRLIAGTELDHVGKSCCHNRYPGSPGIYFEQSRTASIIPGKTEWLAMFMIAAFFVALVRLGRDPGICSRTLPDGHWPRYAGSVLVVVAAFLVNRNIFNSDNYRYLVFLLTPWALGFGLWMNDLAKMSWAGRLLALIIAALLFEMMTSAAFLWYRDKRLYVDQWGCPVRTQGPDWSELTFSKRVWPMARRPTLRTSWCRRT